MKTPHTEWLLISCPKLCPNAGVWKVAECVADPTVEEAVLVWQENFDFKKPPEEDASKLRDILEKWNERKAGHIKVEAIVQQKDHVQFFFSMLCPFFYMRHLWRFLRGEGFPYEPRWMEKFLTRNEIDEIRNKMDKYVHMDIDKRIKRVSGETGFSRGIIIWVYEGRKYWVELQDKYELISPTGIELHIDLFNKWRERDDYAVEWLGPCPLGDLHIEFKVPTIREVENAIWKEKEVLKFIKKEYPEWKHLKKV